MIDLHCDTALKLYELKSTNLYENDLQVDLVKLKKSHAMAQVFAFFINQREIPAGMRPFQYFSDIYAHFMACLRMNERDVVLATKASDLDDPRKKDKIKAFLSIEGGEAIEDQLSHVQDVYDMGIRLMTLTWNYPNAIGYPNATLMSRHRGLTPFGKEVVEEMDRLGMLVDVSHLSDQGFIDVARHVKGPFIATHSNARQVMGHSRNLTDKMIQTLARRGGVTGINFYAPFVDHEPVSRVCNIVKHIKYLKRVGGIDVIALGTDYDGIDDQVELRDISQMHRLIHYLEKEGFTGGEIDKILYGNVKRVFKEVLK